MLLVLYVELVINCVTIATAEELLSAFTLNQPLVKCHPVEIFLPNPIFLLTTNITVKNILFKLNILAKSNVNAKPNILS